MKHNRPRNVNSNNGPNAGVRAFTQIFGKAAADEVPVNETSQAERFLAYQLMRQYMGEPHEVADARAMMLSRYTQENADALPPEQRLAELEEQIVFKLDAAKAVGLLTRAQENTTVFQR